MNKDLYDKKIPFPEDKRVLLKKSFSKVGDVDENIAGYKRNKELQNTQFIGYKQLKRIKNKKEQTFESFPRRSFAS